MALVLGSNVFARRKKNKNINDKGLKVRGQRGQSMLFDQNVYQERRGQGIQKCVCVCVTLGVTGILSDCFIGFDSSLFQQGVAADHLGPVPTKAPI